LRSYGNLGGIKLLKPFNPPF